MQKGRPINIDNLTYEKAILSQLIREKKELETGVNTLGDPRIPNQVGEDTLGLYRGRDSRKAVISEMSLLEEFQKDGLPVPSFYTAGPRAMLCHDPQRVNAAIVTAGGLAPGLHCVIHGIVKRHRNTYGVSHGKILGVYNSFKGLCNLANNQEELKSETTEEWLGQGGCKLGNIRYYPDAPTHEDKMRLLVENITKNLEYNSIDILYIIGGDGSLMTAHEIAKRNPNRSIIGIPKTMDNDILWVWNSFGFDTAVEKATDVINTMHCEAESTRRIVIIELFGAQSGFVAANASLASGRVNLVLIPEVFQNLSADQIGDYLEDAVRHIIRTVQNNRLNPHAVIVLAEGVQYMLSKKGYPIQHPETGAPCDFKEWLQFTLCKRVRNAAGEPVTAFLNEPRHYIRSVPANAHDQVYCECLGALAVDNALAGYTDTMISRWLNEFVLVPLGLVVGKQKSLFIPGMFWKQVINSTGQPLSNAERCTPQSPGPNPADLP